MSPPRLLTPRVYALVVLVVIAAVSRLLPHPENITPIGALALFSGACFADRRVALAVPLVALFLGDLVTGLHFMIPVVYGSFALNVLIGRFWLRRRRVLIPIACATLLGAVQFFVVTNFGLWALGGYYPRTWQGLVTCYVNAIPYLQRTLLGDMTFVVVLFGGLALVERAFPRLREAIPAPA
jgi:hypothetical protein